MILTEDIQLKKSAVMGDVPEGGGALTGAEVVDGQSNNLFPDTSAVDRAFGRVNARLLYGVVHTDNTDMALGAHAIITDAPDDPLVHCTLMRADWAEERDSMQSRIERYVVKGPRITYRLYDTHYADSQIIRLISLVGGKAPAGGDGLVLRNPNGAEQFVRIVRTETALQQVAVVESNGTVLIDATVVTCTLTNPLDYDFLGPPAMRVGLVESAWAQVYSTNQAAGAKFYGIKPLAAAAAPGERLVLAEGGIYTPLVPAATFETPIVDVAPYQRLRTVSPSGYVNVTVPTVTMAVGAGTVLKAPGPISPKSLALTLGGIAFSELGDGVLLQAGATPVGTVDYGSDTGAGAVTFSASAPVYGSVTVSMTYKPATAVDADPYSTSFTVTGANQGRSYVNAFTPPPAPGTFGLDYMAQGRWYSMADDGVPGKLAGADSSYGAGTINSATGSMAVTLGALPDIGSVLLATYGAGAAVTPYDLATVPTGLSAVIEVPWDKPMSTLRWISAGVAKSANWVEAVGHLLSQDYVAAHATGDASMTRLKNSPLGHRFRFTPTSIPDGPVTMDYQLATPTSASVITANTVTTPKSTTFLDNNGGSYTLTDTAAGSMQEGSLSAELKVVLPSNAVYPGAIVGLYLHDKAGRVLTQWAAPTGSVTLDLGTIDYVTGEMVLDETIELPMWLRTYTAPPAGSAWFGDGTYENAVGLGQAEQLFMLNVEYQIGLPSETTYTSSEVITWTYATSALPLALSGWTLALPSSPAADATNGVMFRFNNALYTCNAGLLRTGWSLQTGLPSVLNAGSLSADGVLSFAAVPPGAPNVVTWLNLTHDISPGLSSSGVFRTVTAPIKTGVFQLQSGELIGSANDTGTLAGDYTGSVDALRGVVRWKGAPIEPEALTYNAVTIDYLPMDKDLLGIDTVRLPLDGEVPIYAAGDLLVVHNTLTTQLPNPLVKGVAYDLGRERIASVRVKDALGALVPSSLYTSDLDPGTLTVPAESSITAFTQPLSVEHRIEDMMVCAQADISGQLKFTSMLTHNFPAESSFVSSALMFGDLLARAYGYIEQPTWTGVWSDERIGSAPLANFNDGQYPIAVTNRGAITERWALIFSNTTTFRIVGENVGDIGTGTTGADCAPINPATSTPYFTLPALGWGNGWATGNVLRFNTSACGAPFWAVRTVLQGPATLESDVFSLAFRCDVDRP